MRRGMAAATAATEATAMGDEGIGLAPGQGAGRLRVRVRAAVRVNGQGSANGVRLRVEVLGFGLECEDRAGTRRARAHGLRHERVGCVGVRCRTQQLGGGVGSTRLRTRLVRVRVRI